MALELLEARGHEILGLRSKSWSEFEGAGAPALPFESLDRPTLTARLEEIGKTAAPAGDDD